VLGILKIRKNTVKIKFLASFSANISQFYKEMHLALNTPWGEKICATPRHV